MPKATNKLRHDSAPKPKPTSKPKLSIKPAVDSIAESTIESASFTGFDDLGLSAGVRQAVTLAGYESPTPIQVQAIPVLMQGRDLIGQAQTGTGKTAAFALPIVEALDPSRNETQALVLAPTRELAMQVAGEIFTFAKHKNLRVVPVYGGQPIDRQFRALRPGAHIVVGTPGRLLDHIRRTSISLANVSLCVLDEADEMLDLGFMEDITTILAELPEKRQIAMFSATMPPKVALIAKKFLHDAIRIQIEPKRRTLETTNQTYYEVPKGKKTDALIRVLDMETPGPTIVFCRTRNATDELADALRLQGYNADSLHGEMVQTERDRVMRRFREGLSDLLIATDVAARGLDIDTVTHVINYDIPWDVEQYIHRIGRTGRAGREGDAITLIEPSERRQLRNIEFVIGSKLKPVRIPTGSDIAARRNERFKESLRNTLKLGDYQRHLGTVSELADEFDAEDVAAAALHMLWETGVGAAKDADDDGADFGEQPEAGMTRLFVGAGRQNGLKPGDLVGAIVNEAGLSAKEIGVIDILDQLAFVEVPAGSADRVIAALSKTRIRGKKVLVKRAKPGGPMAYST